MQRLLVEAKRTEAAPVIRKLAVAASNPKVRLQSLENLANREGDHPQMRLAFLSSLPPENPPFVKLNDASKIAIPAVVLPKPSTADCAAVMGRYAE